MIPVASPSLGEEELNNVVEAMKSGWIGSRGKFVTEFEQGFASYCGTNYGVATSNGTTALHLILETLDIGEGDEVIVPALTFIAVPNSVVYTGATPVFADVDPIYWGISPEDIAQKITPQTRAIVCVHLYGHPCDMEAIYSIAKENDVWLIEDAAEAHGAEYRGKKTGGLGDISCFSFYGNKTITTGEGGICLTSNEEVAQKMRILRDHGMDPNRKYWHEVIGFNYRMTNLQAAVGVAQLAKLDHFVEQKRKIANWYFEDFEQLAKNEKVTLHPQMPWAKCSFWIYSILLNGLDRGKRDKVIAKLAKDDIESRPFFPCVHKMPPHFRKMKFPAAEELSDIGLMLPSGVELRREQVSRITDALKNALESV